jgi:hypothetical protein
MPAVRVPVMSLQAAMPLNTTEVQQQQHQRKQ